jgi:hypothetical protein
MTPLEVPAGNSTIAPSGPAPGSAAAPEQSDRGQRLGSGVQNWTRLEVAASGGSRLALAELREINRLRPQ